MSFSFQFAASSIVGARHKLREVDAPEGVKALVELSLAGVREPAPIPPPPSTQGGMQDGAATGRGVSGSGRTYAPRFLGVFVEAFGHIDQSGGRSHIERFIVQPLYE